MTHRSPLLLQYRVLFPLVAFAAVAIASETYGPAALWLALPLLLLYVVAPALPLWQLRRRLLPGRLPAEVLERWAAICREYRVEADLHLIEYGSPNGVSAGGRRGGVAAVSPQALVLDDASLDLLLRHLALQLSMGVSRHNARGVLNWLYASAFAMGMGGYAYFTNDEISLLGFILSIIFGLFFLFGSGSFGHQVKWAVDERLVKVTGQAEAVQALVERVIRESIPYGEVDLPPFTGPLWFAVPHGAKEHGESPQWDSLTLDRTKRIAKERAM
jgi:hypothetical protein